MKDVKNSDSLAFEESRGLQRFLLSIAIPKLELQAPPSL